MLKSQGWTRAARMLCVMLSATLVMTGCEEPDDDEGVVITGIELPTDTLLNLYCPDVGIATETCVLQDPENPYRTAVVNEFDPMNPDAPTKFQLFNEIPPGETGAKARFYLWATALARRNDGFGAGENQWYLAQALHELYNYNEDENIRLQALRAYRSVWDNYFGSVTFFECCAGVSLVGEPVPFPIQLNERIAFSLWNPAFIGWVPIITMDPDDFDPLLALSQFGEWGYTYVPPTLPPPPGADPNDLGVLSVNEG